MRLALRVEFVLGLLWVAKFVFTIAWTVNAPKDEAAFRASRVPLAIWVVSRVLLLTFAVTGIRLDALIRSLPRAPAVRRTGAARWLVAAEAWIPGAILAMVCLLNFSFFSFGAGSTAFLVAVCVISVLTAASSAGLARRVRDFDRFHAGCLDVPERVRLGPVAVWCLWVAVAGACWLAAMYLRSLGPYYEGFDIRTVRAVLIGSAIVWFIAVGSARRALRRWSDG